MEMHSEQQDESWADILPTIPMWSAPFEVAQNNTTVQIIYEETTNPLPDAIPITRNFNFQELPPQSPELGLMLANVVPPASPGPPDRTTFTGELNFAVLVNSQNAKKKYLYSARLNRIYVDGDVDFPLEFRWESVPGAPRPMFVRATVVFSDRDQAERRVETCIHHRSILERNKQLKDPQLGNVLHSSRDDSSSGVQYAGGPDTWHSTVVRYENNPRTHAYKFVCKNSCSGGINRRPICIIFTLEDIRGYVHGREIVSVRVCACPRRDLHKDEKAEALAPGSEKRELVARRPEPGTDSRKTKKIKLEVVTETTPASGTNDKIVQIPSLKLRAGAAIAGFEVVLRMLEEHQRLLKDNGKMVSEDAVMIAAVQSVLDNIKAESQ